MPFGFPRPGELLHHAEIPEPLGSPVQLRARPGRDPDGAHVSTREQRATAPRPLALFVGNLRLVVAESVDGEHHPPETDRTGYLHDTRLQPGPEAAHDRITYWLRAAVLPWEVSEEMARPRSNAMSIGGPNQPGIGAGATATRPSSITGKFQCSPRFFSLRRRKAWACGDFAREDVTGREGELSRWLRPTPTTNQASDDRDARRDAGD